jgi:hypothetical protein
MSELDALGATVSESFSETRSSTPHWHFRQMQPGEENQNPIQGEFFTPDSLGELCDVLVRESIQNSLDAEPVEPVKVKIHSGGLQRHSDARIVAQKQYFNGLWEHISSEKSGLRGCPDATGLLQYICIEDFNTSGLDGDPAFDDNEAPLAENDRNNFFYFWRNIARSGKNTKELGSWGVGKQVFAASSCINTYFGLSVRKDDLCTSLMGKTILKIHHAPYKCSPYGYWAVFEESRPDFAMPVGDDNSVTQSFADDFNLQRSGEPGLSIVVPFCRIELLKTKEICAAVIRHYFYPILTGRLSVDVGITSRPSPDNPADWTIIDKSTIESIATEILGKDNPEFVSLLELASWAQTVSDEQHLQPIKNPDFSKAPDWRDQPLEDEALDEAWRLFEEQGRIAVRIPVRIMKDLDKVARCGWMKIYYGRGPEDVATQVKYVRQGIDIVSANNSKLGKGVVGMLEVDDPDLGALLRAAEPPAHDKWETRAGRLDEYEKGAKSVRFVIHAPHKLWNALSGVATKRDPDLLRDIFFVDLNELTNPKSSKKQGPKKTKDTIPEDIEVPEPPTRRYSPVVTPIRYLDQCGFQLSPPSDATDTPQSITVRCAYETVSGNPFRNYSTLDFKLNRAPMQIQIEGAELENKTENSLTAKILSGNYKIVVSGFDPNRDLRTSVQVELETDEAEMEEEES